jgi:hypothetical protein
MRVFPLVFNLDRDYTTPAGVARTCFVGPRPRVQPVRKAADHEKQVCATLLTARRLDNVV